MHYIRKSSSALPRPHVAHYSIMWKNDVIHVRYVFAHSYLFCTFGSCGEGCRGGTKQGGLWWIYNWLSRWEQKQNTVKVHCILVVLIRMTSMALLFIFFSWSIPVNWRHSHDSLLYSRKNCEKILWFCWKQGFCSFNFAICVWMVCTLFRTFNVFGEV